MGGDHVGIGRGVGMVRVGRGLWVGVYGVGNTFGVGREFGVISELRFLMTNE
jgi:hypothetical protein